MSGQDSGPAFESGDKGDLAAPPDGHHGPDGQVRELWFVILLSIITFGIYCYYWVYKQFKELKDYSGHGIGGWIGVIFFFIFSPVIWFLLPSEVGRLLRNSNDPESISGWSGLWLFLPLVGAFVWVIKIQGRMNRFWQAR